MIYKFLFPMKPDSNGASLFLLVLRIFFGLLLMSHGLQKWSHFQELSISFPDPLGVGSTMSLALAIFAELGCSVAFIVGFLYRLALVPMIFTMCVACFIVLVNDPFSAKELALIYLVVFVVMYVAGPGKFSVDHWLGNQLRSQSKN